TYVGRSGEDLTSVEVIAPRLEELIILAGDLAAKKPIQHVALRGLTFSFTDWSTADSGYTDRQAAVAIQGDVRAEAVVDCVVQDCTFTHLAGYALDFGGGCQRNKIIGNEIFDIGAGGVRIGETAKRTEPFEQTHDIAFTDNHLHHLGLIYAPAVGVLIL